MKRTFFDEHISVTKYDIECQWVSGLSLRVEYKKLGFSSYEHALKAFQHKIGGHRPENLQVSYYVPGKLPRTDGYPYLLGRGVVDMERNVCVYGYMNLVTAEAVTHASVCRFN